MKKNFVCFAKPSGRTDLAITTQTASARNDSASCHCEERSDVAIARLVKSNDNAITTSNAAHSPRNDNTVMSLRATERSVAIAKRQPSRLRKC